MRNRNLTQLSIIISDCEQFKEESRSFSQNITTLGSKFNQRIHQLERRIRTESWVNEEQTKTLKNGIQLHKYLSRRIFDSAASKSPLHYAKPKTSKYVQKETTHFDKNPVLYLRQQIRQMHLKSRKLSTQTRLFSRQQQGLLDKIQLQRIS